MLLMLQRSSTLCKLKTLFNDEIQLDLKVKLLFSFSLTHSFGLFVVGHEEAGAHPDALRATRGEPYPGVDAHGIPVTAQHVARRRRQQTAPHGVRQGLSVRRQHVVHAHQLQQRRQNLAQLNVCKFSSLLVRIWPKNGIDFFLPDRSRFLTPFRVTLCAVWLSKFGSRSSMRRTNWCSPHLRTDCSTSSSDACNTNSNLNILHMFEYEFCYFESLAFKIWT
jgi:hypothetical protein